MARSSYNSQISIAETAEKLGKKAVGMGIISNFSINISSENWQFNLEDSDRERSLTAEEAYLYFKKIVPRYQ